MTASQSPVLITGATGNTGGAVLQELVSRGIRVRAVVRHANDVDRLAAHPDEIAVADLNDEQTVAAALQGVECAYLVTPSSEHAERQQTRFAELASDAGVRRLVVLSQLGAALGSPVRFLRYHAAVEQHIQKLGIGYVFVRPNLFFQGLLALAPVVADHSTLPAPIGEARVSAVDVEDIAAVCVLALTGSEHDGATYTVTGPEALTHNEMARTLGSARGRDVNFVDIEPKGFREQLEGVLPPWQADGLLEDYAHYARGEAAQITDTVPKLTGRPAHSFQRFAEHNADAFR